ncbi:hypothetical protein [Streptomyces sp. NPDC002122]|uniref:hypothetical protein n=1 Tax=Streptomyces sp. NPDC002122 TaxID=3154407 RepID=UPI00332A228B
MVASVAAIGGLGFAGWSTYYGARVASDQLIQSEKVNQETQRKQASMVNFWYDQATGQVSVANRSLDPAYGTDIAIQFSLGSYESPIWWSQVNTIPPCTVVQIKASDIISAANKKSGTKTKPDHFATQYLAFADSNGGNWIRTGGETGSGLHFVDPWSEFPFPDGYTLPAGDDFWLNIPHKRIPMEGGCAAS